MTRQCVNCPGAEDHNIAPLMQARSSQTGGYMPIPTAEQLAEALENVGSFHDMSAELIAPELLANLLAAPTVKAEQVRCADPCGLAPHAQAFNEAPAEALIPSLPAAGSAELEEAAGILRNMIDSIDVHGNYSKESTLLFLNQALSSITAALSAQQSAPERVSVPVELLERAIHWLRSHAPGTDCAEWDTADELRALLASHAEGGKA